MTGGHAPPLRAARRGTVAGGWEGLGLESSGQDTMIHVPVALITEKLRGQTLEDDIKVPVSVCVRVCWHYYLSVCVCVGIKYLYSRHELKQPCIVEIFLLVIEMLFCPGSHYSFSL